MKGKTLIQLFSALICLVLFTQNSAVAPVKAFQPVLDDETAAHQRLTSALGAKKLPFLGWADAEPENCDVDDSIEQFPSGTKNIYACFGQSSSVEEGDTLNGIWYFNGEQTLKAELELDQSDWFWFSLYNKKSLEDGLYRLELYIGKTLIGEAEILIGDKEDSGAADEPTLVWTNKIDNKHCPIKEVSSYPSETLMLQASHVNVASLAGETVFFTWYADGEETASNKTKYPKTNCFGYSLDNADEPLPDGTYGLELVLGKKIIAESEITIGNESNSPDTGVAFQGTVIDADSGKPIKGSFVVLLNPGVDIARWLDKEMPEKDIYSATKTDRTGKFRIEINLERGQVYPLVVGASEQGYTNSEGEIEVPEDADDVIDIEIEMQKN